MMVLAGLVGFAQDVPVADVKCGPWVTNVSDEAFNVLWTSNYRTLSYVEVAPDDGSDFDACRRQRFYQTVSGRRVIDTFHNVITPIMESLYSCLWQESRQSGS